MVAVHSENLFRSMLELGQKSGGYTDVFHNNIMEIEKFLFDLLTFIEEVMTFFLGHTLYGGRKILFSQYEKTQNLT
jgi:hypothetical protein